MAEEKDSVRKKVGRPRKYASLSEKQKAIVARKLETTVQIKAFITPEARSSLNELCKKHGMSQGELLTVLIQHEKSDGEYLN